MSVQVVLIIAEAEVEGGWLVVAIITIIIAVLVLAFVVVSARLLKVCQRLSVSLKVCPLRN